MPPIGLNRVTEPEGPRRRFVGIDPGLSGAVVMIDSAGRLLASMTMPRMMGSKGPLDPTAIHFWMRDVACSGDAIVSVALERMQVRPGEGAKGARTAGINWGTIQGIIVALGLRYDTPTPNQWQKVVCPGGGEAKQRSLSAARRLFPDLDLTPGRRTRPHDGLSDAACLAEFARRRL